MTLENAYTPKLKGTQNIAVFSLVCILAYYTYSALQRGKKYVQLLQRYQKPGAIDAVPMDVMRQLSLLKGLSFSSIGTWVTISYGVLGVMLLMTSNK